MANRIALVIQRILGDYLKIKAPGTANGVRLRNDSGILSVRDFGDTQFIGVNVSSLNLYNGSVATNFDAVSITSNRNAHMPNTTGTLLLDETQRYRGPVQAAVGTNVSVSSAPATFDGYTATTNDVILLYGQSTGHENGPWVFHGSGNAMLRPSWYASGDVVMAAQGLSLGIINGLTNAGKIFYLETAPVVTIDTTATSWGVLIISGAGSLEVTDGTTNVTGVTKIKFSGAAVSTPSAGEADVAVSGGGAMAQIARQVLSGSAASITFSSIPGSYNDLLLVLKVRTDAGGSNVGLQFNGDTGGNYDWQYIQTTGGGSTIGDNGGDTSGFVGFYSNSGAPANVASAIRVHIPDYAGTTWEKSFTSEGAQIYGHGAPAINTTQTGDNWRNTAAINQIVIVPASGNFVTGSVATLYGIT